MIDNAISHQNILLKKRSLELAIEKKSVDALKILLEIPDMETENFETFIQAKTLRLMSLNNERFLTKKHKAMTQFFDKMWTPV